MRVLWDFRLFSYNYAQRGVGIYTRALTQAILNQQPSWDLFIWGAQKLLPNEMQTWPATFIPYTPGSWKGDLLHIPRLIKRYKIDLFHYWAALDPMHNFGMGLHHRCKSVATVYDLAVEFWQEVPFASAKRKTWYWKYQKHLYKNISHGVCISQATESEVIKLFPQKQLKTSICYPPYPKLSHRAIKQRKPLFIALGGSPHKNLKRIIEAFREFSKDNPEYSLHIFGVIDKSNELPSPLPSSVHFNSMDQYSTYLDKATALISCSLHEGLGLPPLEAMSHGCPILLSDIPTHRETCTQSAHFVNPQQPASIVAGMQEITQNTDTWILKSKQGFRQYRNRARSSAQSIISLYNDLLE